MPDLNINDNDLNTNNTNLNSTTETNSTAVEMGKIEVLGNLTRILQSHVTTEEGLFAQKTSIYSRCLDFFKNLKSIMTVETNITTTSDDSEATDVDPDSKTDESETAGPEAEAEADAAPSTTQNLNLSKEQVLTALENLLQQDIDNNKDYLIHNADTASSCLNFLNQHANDSIKVSIDVSSTEATPTDATDNTEVAGETAPSDGNTEL